MTCKDCIHCEVCHFAYEPPLSEQCEDFVDKSRCIYVPEKVYQTDGVRVYEIEVNGIIFDSGSVAFDARAIGQSVFLTREEAEERIEK